MTENSIEFKKQKETIIEYGLKPTTLPLDIVEYPHPNKNQVLIPKKKSLEKNIRKSESLKISEVDSTLKEKNLRPYWNNACKELQSKLWLPHKIESQEPDLNSLNGSLNYTEDQSSFWKTRILPTNPLTQKHSFLSSLPSLIPITEKDQVIGTKKIRLKIKNTKNIDDLINLHRRSYNLTIEYIKNKSNLSKTEVRRRVREIVRKEAKENGTTFSSVVSDEATNNAYRTFEACLRKWKNKQKAELKFKSKKQPTQNFIIQKLSSKGAFPTILKDIFYTEEIPKEAIGAMATITRVNGRYFLSCKKFIETKSVEIQDDLNSCVSLDQGIRTFVTTFNNKSCNKYGDGFSETKLLPLYLKKDKLLSDRQKLMNIKVDKQWWYDRIKSIQRKINKIQNRIDDLILDLHNKVCFDLVSNYDVIICPLFETQKMAQGKLRKRTIREMINLSFFKFKMRLKWYCKKYGKVFLDTTEEYTSKTKSWNGEIVRNLGSSKVIKDGTLSCDRDINGARGIMLLTLTRQLTP